ncbi:MAG TPA: peptidoglycan recognition family protein [Microlunatus sp.]|nr:peptidoglycan recognition family protein [Microlunatus sp.]
MIFSLSAPMLTRRTLLTSALAGSVLAGSDLRPARAREPGAGGDLVPEVLSSTGTAGGVQEPGFPVHHLGLSWSGTEKAGRLRLRYADGWRAWRPVRAGDSANGRRHALVWVGSASAYEFQPETGSAGVDVRAINTVDGPPTGQTFGPTRRLTASGLGDPATRSGCRYLSRHGWGADESWRFGPDGTESFPTAFFDVQTLTVHHTVTANTDPDPAATVRAIYFFHAVTEDYGDIGYHLLVDQHGTVYEGRYSGPDQVPVFGPRSVGPRPSMVNGAHVAGFNAGNVGVALLGDLTAAGPTPAARLALTRVLAALAGATGLDPLGTTAYVNPISGATRTVRTLAGHRDWAATECPGNAFYPSLPQLRVDVAAALGARSTSTVVLSAGRR